MPWLFSIGHSNHELDHFLDLLRANEVDVLVDVRSWPRSGYSRHFDQAPLRRSLEAAGVRYLFLGVELGGRPDDLDCYDETGHVLYDRVAASAPFSAGIDRLLQGMSRYRVAMMCSEESPLECHRRLLVGRVLADRGVTVRHIRGDGHVEEEGELIDPAGTAHPTLFDDGETTLWRSTRSVSPSTRPRSSSGP